MAGKQDLANGSGFLYMTDSAGTLVKVTEKNTAIGLQVMRGLASGMAPVSMRQSAMGVILVSNLTGPGTLSVIDILGVNQIGATINIVSVSKPVVAAQIATAINSFTPGSGDKYTAQTFGDKVFLYSPLSTGAAANGRTINLTYSAGNTFTTTPFTNGADIAATINPTVNCKFYLNANYGGTAVSNDKGLLAIDVTEYIVNRPANVGMDVQETTIIADAVSGIKRRSFFTTLIVDTQAAAPTDKLGYISTETFQEGDLLMIMAKSPDRSITVESAQVSTLPLAVKNLFLTNNNQFVTNGYNAIFAQYRYDDVNGGYWSEIVRSVGAPNYDVELTRAEAVALRTASQFEKGKRYWVYDIADGTGLGQGVGGIILTAVSPTAFDPQGVFIARVVNRTAVPTLFDKDEVVAIGQHREWLNEVYVKTSAVNTGLPPSDDLANWDFVLKSDNTKYSTEIENCIYSFNTDVIKARWDFRNNRIENTSNRPANELMLQAFRFGTDDVYNNFFTYKQDNDGWAPGTRTPVDLNIFNLSLCGSLFNNISHGAYITEASNKRHLADFSNNTIAAGQVLLQEDWAGMTNNTLVSNTIMINTGMFLGSNTMIGCTVDTNTQLNIQGNSFYGATIQGNATVEITGTTNVANSTLFIVNNVDFKAYNVQIQGVNTLIQDNVLVTMQGGILENASIANNVGSAMFPLAVTNNVVRNGAINTVDGSGVSFYTAGQLTNNILIRSTIENINFIQVGGPGQVMKIDGCVLSNSIIRRLTFNAQPSLVNIPSNTSAVMQLNGLNMTGTYIDGEGNTAIPYGHAVSTTRFGLSLTSGQLSGVTITPDHSGFYGYLNVADPAVYNAGVLTIPAGLQHIGRFYLYNTTGVENITAINNLGIEVAAVPAEMRNNRSFSRKFSVWDGGGVSFTPTAKAGATTSQIVASALAAVVLAGPGDWIEIKREGLKVADANTYLIKQAQLVTV